jgi:AcrR family transcriptional regulator
MLTGRFRDMPRCRAWTSEGREIERALAINITPSMFTFAGFLPDSRQRIRQRTQNDARGGAVVSRKPGAGEREFSTAACCARILERHRDTIEVRKDHVACANLVRIIEATLKLSNKKGFHATSLRELAKASGLSMGGLYAYFANKAMLLSMILREVTETIIEILNSPPENLASDPRAHLRWIIDTHIRVSEQMVPWFVFGFMEAKSFPENERKLAIDAEATTEKIIADVLERGVAQGIFAIGEVALTASLIKPLLQDWYVKRAKYRRRGTTIDDYIEALTDFVETAVGARTPLEARMPLASGNVARLRSGSGVR